MGYCEAPGKKIHPVYPRCWLNLYFYTLSSLVVCFWVSSPHLFASLYSCILVFCFCGKNKVENWKTVGDLKQFLFKFCCCFCFFVYKANKTWLDITSQPTEPLIFFLSFRSLFSHLEIPPALLERKRVLWCIILLLVMQANMKEDIIQNLASEMDELQEQHRDVLAKVMSSHCLYCYSHKYKCV